MSKRRRLSYEIIREEFELAGCKLVSKEYNPREKLRYICKCGNESIIKYDKFRIGQRCRDCRNKKIADNARHDYEHVKKVFDEGGCVLLSDSYDNGKQKLNYICNCGSKSKIAFVKFSAGQRCNNCRYRRISASLRGSNSPHYKHDKTDEERLLDRKYPEYRKWRKDVFIRDDYTCQYCFERGGKLNAHHVESYSHNPELRTDINNGITLCETHHREYHRNYYKNDADRESFESFVRGDHCEEPSNVDNMREEAYEYEYAQW
jgi:5-methylcytosine-specific restriction endonuclease McrA